MTPIRLSCAVALTMGFSACTSPVPDATRNLPVNEATGRALTATSTMTLKQGVAGYSLVKPQYNVVAVRVAVPETLRVSEANLYYPSADIVWRGEPRGDRYQQVKAIFEEAFATGTQTLHQGRAVMVYVVVERFHCLTEKARYTVGGVHSLKFSLTVRDVASGQVLDGPRVVNADIKASGGTVAIEEEANGISQRKVILDRLSDVALRELTRPLAVPVPTKETIATPPTMVPVSRDSFDPGDLAH